MLTDTSPEVEKVQIMLLRQASSLQRMKRLRSLSQTVIQLSRRAIQRAHPELNEQEVALLFIAYHYGAELADRVRVYLRSNYAES